MKKISLSLILALSFVLVAVSCGNTEDGTSNEGTASVDSASAVASTEGTSIPEATVDADEFENPTSDDSEAEDTSSTFSVIIGPGDDEEGWGEIF